MNALKLLETQHREVEDLFEEFESTGEGARNTREKLCADISDALAIHSEIEERIFYPEVKAAVPDAEELLHESVEEHLSMKRLVADIMEAGIHDLQLGAKMKVLAEQVQHHAGEEEEELFPKVRAACDEETLDDMGSRMTDLAEKLTAEGEPSRQIPGQTDAPADI